MSNHWALRRFAEDPGDYCALSLLLQSTNKAMGFHEFLRERVLAVIAPPFAIPKAGRLNGPIPLVLQRL